MDSSVSSEQVQETIHQASKHTHDVQGTSLFGFVVFLLSESVIFLRFFAGYTALKTTTDWFPAGVKGLETHDPLINTIVLVSSSFVIYFAEEALKKGKLVQFRLLWLLTSAMGI